MHVRTCACVSLTRHARAHGTALRVHARRVFPPRHRHGTTTQGGGLTGRTTLLPPGGHSLMGTDHVGLARDPIAYEKTRYAAPHEGI